MKQRCENSSNPGFPNYGGRGIRVHPEWSASFEAFLRDVGPRPSTGHSLDRYPNNNGNYEPGNVRWATREQQAVNRRVAVVVEWRGEKYTVTALARLHGIAPKALWYRIVHKKMSVEAALAHPHRAKIAPAS